MAKKFLGVKLSVLSMHSAPERERLVSVIKLSPLMQIDITSQNEIFGSYGGGSNVQKFCVKTKKSNLYQTLDRTEAIPELTGEISDITKFIPSKVVKLIGKGKGHGFSGVVARYGFGRGPMTRGSTHHRAPGSAGAGTFPSRVYPRKKMPGKWKTPERTYDKIQTTKLDVCHGLIWLHGSIPGKKGNILRLAPTLT